ALRHLRRAAVGLVPEADRRGDADDPWRRAPFGEDPGEASASERLRAGAYQLGATSHYSLTPAASSSCWWNSRTPHRDRPTFHALSVTAGSTSRKIKSSRCRRLRTTISPFGSTT